MILLSTRLCMRGSDIVNLEFSNINWDDGYITFMQVKTGIPQSLPIQEEVGIALIDYIKMHVPYATHGNYLLRREHQLDQ